MSHLLSRVLNLLYVSQLTSALLPSLCLSGLSPPASCLHTVGSYRSTAISGLSTICSPRLHPSCYLVPLHTFLFPLASELSPLTSHYSPLTLPPTKYIASCDSEMANLVFGVLGTIPSCAHLRSSSLNAYLLAGTTLRVCPTPCLLRLTPYLVALDVFSRLPSLFSHA